MASLRDGGRAAGARHDSATYTGEPDVKPWRTVAVLMLVAVVGFWAVQWQQAPAGGTVASARGDHGHGSDHDDDDD